MTVGGERIRRMSPLPLLDAVEARAVRTRPTTRGREGWQLACHMVLGQNRRNNNELQLGSPETFVRSWDAACAGDSSTLGFWAETLSTCGLNWSQIS
jgi:hypothetical protein